MIRLIPGVVIRRIAMACTEAGLDTKIIPGAHAIVGGKVNLSRIRPVAIEDFLGREPVRPDEAAISRVVRDRVVLVTGAGGSIGSELCWKWSLLIVGSSCSANTDLRQSRLLFPSPHIFNRPLFQSVSLV